MSEKRIPVKVSPELKTALRSASERKTAHRFLKDFYAAAIEHLAAKRQEIPIDYLVSPQEGETIIVRATAQALEDVNAFAEADSVSQRRVLYTAILLYARHLKIPAA